jgi:hypothetical protein
MGRTIRALPLPALLLLITIPPALLAQYGSRYDGPRVRIDLVRDHPGDPDVCLRYVDKSAESSIRVEVCRFALAEAERMADRYGGGMGRLDGYLRGYAWGLHQRAAASSSDRGGLAAGREDAAKLETHLDAAWEIGEQHGETRGVDRARADVMQLFELAVEHRRQTGEIEMPSADFTTPSEYYDGEADGYRAHVGGIPTPQQILRNELKVARLDVYRKWDRTYLGTSRPVGAWDLWRDDGVYSFDYRDRYDGDRALDAWLRRPVRGATRYSRLNDEYDGNTPGEAPVLDLQLLFREVFIESYEFYVGYYYSRRYYENLDTGLVAGELIGIQLGQRMAYYRGLKEAFNQQFRTASQEAFAAAFERQYGATFTATFDEFLHSAQLDLRLLEIVGVVDDGVLQPGESIAARLAVINFGGEGTEVTIRLEPGSHLEVAGSYVDQVEALETREILTDPVGRVTDGTRPGEQIVIVLDVDGSRLEHSEVVRRILGIHHLEYDPFDVPGGAVRVRATIENLSTITTTSQVDVTLILDGEPTATQVVPVQDTLASGERRETALMLTDRDPRNLIHPGLTGMVRLEMDDQLQDERAVELVLGKPRLVHRELARYFDALVSGVGYVPPDVRHTDRLREIRGHIISLNETEVRDARRQGGNQFESSELASSMIQQIVNQYRSHHPIPDSVHAEYRQLGTHFWEHRRLLKNRIWYTLWLMRYAERKDYERLAQILCDLGCDE